MFQTILRSGIVIPLGIRLFISERVENGDEEVKVAPRLRSASNRCNSSVLLSSELAHKDLSEGRICEVYDRGVWLFCNGYVEVDGIY